MKRLFAISACVLSVNAMAAEVDTQIDWAALKGKVSAKIDCVCPKNSNKWVCEDTSNPNHGKKCRLKGVKGAVIIEATTPGGR